MSYEGSPEPIDFDFFAEDDEDIRSAGSGRNSSHRSSPAVVTTAATAAKSSRPVSASSARSLSSRSSISVKIPSAGPTGVRENAYTFKSRYSDSSDEDNYAAKESRYDNRNTVEVEQNTNAVNRGNEDGSGGEGDSWKKAASSRPKTSKGPRRAHLRRKDSSSSTESKSSNSKSRHSSGSFSSKSEHSDSYTSISSSDSDSDVTDVSPLPSPARSPTPRLEYDQDDFEDSFEENRFRQAREQSSSVNNGNGRQNKKRNRKKESVRFASVVTPNNGSTSQRDKQMDETEARELSRLLRAVLQLEETPNHSQMNSFHRSPTKQRPSSAKRATTTTAPLPHQRVNLSFSNDKVRQIDRENQRLLQKILRRPKSAVAATGFASTRKQDDQPKMMSHSAIRRQREQRKIDMENRKILERIESAHASSTVQRTSLLHEHDRQMKYASQVSKGSRRPPSSRNTGYNYSGSLSKGSSLASLNSDASRTSTASTGSKRMRPSSGRSMPPPPQGPRQAWDERW